MRRCGQACLGKLPLNQGPLINVTGPFFVPVLAAIKIWQ
ncbi:MAG: hypothetical protein OFPI_19880 [Osedax symbiont Rs2]|nr:MAG: hypothetical protein OFPI_19880 [Osedax symbiont Rs2]